MNASSPLTAPLAAASPSQPAGERLAELLLLGGEHLPDRLALLDELRVDAAHLLDDDARPGSVAERLEPEVAPVDDGAADHAPEHVAAPSFDGVTPSATRNVIARPWSA